MPVLTIHGQGKGAARVSNIGLRLGPSESRTMVLTTAEMESVREELVALKKAGIIWYETIAGDIDPALETSLASAIRTAYQNEAALATLAPPLLVDKMVVFVEDGQADWFFDAQSYAVPLAGFVVKPNSIPLANPGRWRKYAGGGGALFLLRTPADFTSFPNKAVPIGTDVLLAEDSADGNSKKYITVGSMIAALNQDTFGLVAARNNFATNIYLYGPNGTPTNLSGFVLHDNATLIGIGAATNGNFTWTAEIRKNGVVAPIASLSIIAAAKGYTSALSVAVSAGDEIQMFCNGVFILQPTIIAYFKRG